MEFDEHGYMARRFASINDQPITEADRKFMLGAAVATYAHQQVIV